MLTEDCLVLKCHFQILNIRDWSLEPLCRQPCEIMSSRTVVMNMLMIVGNLRVYKGGSRVHSNGMLGWMIIYILCWKVDFAAEKFSIGVLTQSTEHHSFCRLRIIYLIRDGFLSHEMVNVISIIIIMTR